MSGTNAVEVIIHATSPFLQSKPLSPHFGAVAAGAASAGAAAGAAASGVAGAASVAAGAAAAGAASSAKLRLLKLNMPKLKALARITVDRIFFMIFPLKRIWTGFTGTDAINLLEIKDKNLPITNLAGGSRLFDGFDHLVEHVIFNGDFQLNFWQKIDDIFSPTVKLGVAFLTPKTLDFSNGNALHADGKKSFPYLVKLKRLDDC